MCRLRWGRDAVDDIIGSSIIGVGVKKPPLFTRVPERRDDVDTAVNTVIFN